MTLWQLSELSMWLSTFKFHRSIKPRLHTMALPRHLWFGDFICLGVHPLASRCDFGIVKSIKLGQSWTIRFSFFVTSNQRSHSPEHVWHADPTKASPRSRSRVSNCQSSPHPALTGKWPHRGMEGGGDMLGRVPHVALQSDVSYPAADGWRMIAACGD